nr:hypothetical protein [Leptospira mtsangambouensis]
MKQEEVWDFQSVTQVHLGFLGFLTLRGFLRESLSLPKLQVKGLSKHWKTYLAKVNFLGKGVPWESQEFIPNLVSDSLIPALTFSGKGHWAHEFHWERVEKDTTSVFFSATNKQSEGDIAISDLMKDFLQYSQTHHYLDRAYIRKENSSYLYLNSKETNPRVFFRENPTDLPEFLFLVAELKTKNPTHSN